MMVEVTLDDLSAAVRPGVEVSVGQVTAALDRDASVSVALKVLPSPARARSAGSGAAAPAAAPAPAKAPAKPEDGMGRIGDLKKMGY